MTLRSRSTQYDSIPLDDARVLAKMHFPDCATPVLPLAPKGDSVYEAAFTAPLPGVFTPRIGAEGREAVRALVAFDDIPAGTVATIDQVRSDADEWRFSVVWQCFRAKGRSPYSLFFTAEHLPQFELADDGSDRARVTEMTADTRLRQLCLPFTEWALYQGTEVIDRWRYPEVNVSGAG